MEKIINLIFPTKCIVCKELGNVLCTLCLSRCQILKQDYCLVCDNLSGRGFTHEECLKNHNKAPERLISVFSYEGAVRQVIRSSKYGRKEHLALASLCVYGINLISNSLSKEISGFEVISVPPSKKNLSKRGFNQADIIAKIFSKKYGLKILSKVIKRDTKTESQYKYDRNDRFKSVEGVFSVPAGNKEELIGKNIFIVDDIVTSGATLLELSRVLYENGVNRVVCFTLSKKVLV